VRFCPFCSAENPSDAAQCSSCGRRLPPLPPRRQAGQTGPRPAVTPSTSPPAAAPASGEAKRTLLSSLVPPPTALRRESPPSEVRPAGADSRRRGDISSVEPTTVEATTVDPRRMAPAVFEDDEATEIRDPAVHGEPEDLSKVLRGLGNLVDTAVAPDPAHDATLRPPPSMPAGATPGRTKPASVPPPVAPAPIGPRNTPDALPPVPRPRPPQRLGSSPPPTPPPRPRTATAPPTPVPAPPKLPPTPSMAAQPPREPTLPDPPPTRIARADALLDRPFTPPTVIAIPEVPEQGLVSAARYAVVFLRARWQRRGAIRLLQDEIKQDTTALDQVLGTLGRAARTAKVDNRVLGAENQAIDDAEGRRGRLEQAQAELSSRKNDEAARFLEIEHERIARVTEAERNLDEAQRELATLEAQRRGLRDKRKDLERRQKAYLKAAEDRDGESGNAPLGDSRAALRRQAEDHRREAASLEPERQEVDRKLTALERPIAETQTRVETTKVDVEAARRSLHDAREGHRHRVAELDAEHARKGRELAQAEAEIQRRMVTLGTLINLNRIERPEFVELYERVDRLRAAIGARTTEIEKLAAEREAFDRSSLTRGLVVIGAGVVTLVTLIAILLALL